MRKTVFLLLVLLVIGSSSNLAQAARPQQGAGNLLQNPGFEDGFSAWSGLSEIQVAHGWTPWWRDRNDDDPPEQYFRPEYKHANGYIYPNRVRSGVSAQQWFTFCSTHQAGMYQQVFNVTPGHRYRFTIWAHVWSSVEHDPYQSVDPSNPHLRVGIDPTGNWNPWADTITWSPEYYHIDAWGELAVEAVAENDTITVFMHSHPEFPLPHNDTYWDDAALIDMNQQPPPPPTATPVPAEPTATPAPVEPTATSPAEPTATTPPAPDVTPSPTRQPTTPAPTATCAPPPEGWLPYKVQRGDTLFSLAKSHGVTLDEVVAANCLQTTDLYVDQSLLLPPAASNTPAPATSTAVPATVATSPVETGGPPVSAVPATPTPTAASATSAPNASPTRQSTATTPPPSDTPKPPTVTAPEATAIAQITPASATVTSQVTSTPQAQQGSNNSGALLIGLLGVVLMAAVVIGVWKYLK